MRKWQRVKNETEGFTLVELLATMTILIIILAISVPSVSGVIRRSRVAADQNTVALLNKATSQARLTISAGEKDPFLADAATSEKLLKYLVDTGHLVSAVKPQSKEAEFGWFITDEKWYLADNPSLVGVQIWRSGDERILSGTYTGKAKDIAIPLSLDGEDIIGIYQDVFKGKELNSIRFAENSKIKQIHARAFQNNQLKKIIFPDSLTKIDFWSFKGNQLTEIQLPATLERIQGSAFKNNDLKTVTIGDDVDIGAEAFAINKNLTEFTIGKGAKIGKKIFGDNTKNFVEAYESGQAGTYKLIEGEWKRESE